MDIEWNRRNTKN